MRGALSLALLPVYRSLDPPPAPGNGFKTPVNRPSPRRAARYTHRFAMSIASTDIAVYDPSKENNGFRVMQHRRAFCRFEAKNSELLNHHKLWVCNANQATKYARHHLRCLYSIGG